MKHDPAKDSEIKAAAHLASVEIVAGSLGHGFKIPFTGTLLSYYQLYISLWLLICVHAHRSQVFNMSVIVALLKTLSPFGKKITPMIAISMQGFLLWLGTIFLGIGWTGLALGSMLLVTWSMIQAVIGYVLIYGYDFIQMVDYFQQEIREYSSFNIYAVLLGYWVLKVILALGMIFYLKMKPQSAQWLIDESALARMRQRMTTSSAPQSASNAMRALRDLVNPFFVFSLFLMIAFHFLKKTPHEQIIWFVCRSLGVGFLLFYLVRSDWVKRGMFSLFGQHRGFRRLYRKMYRVRRLVNV